MLPDRRGREKGGERKGREGKREVSAHFWIRVTARVPGSPVNRPEDCTCELFERSPCVIDVKSAADRSLQLLQVACICRVC